MSKAAKKIKTIRIPSAKSGDQPATRKMLGLVRDELKHDIRALDQKMEAGFAKIESRFESIDSRFASIDSRFASIDSQFVSIDSRFDSMESNLESLEFKLGSQISEVHALLTRMSMMMEEQKANNRIVLEGHQLLWEKYQNHEVALQNAKLL